MMLATTLLPPHYSSFWSLAILEEATVRLRPSQLPLLTSSHHNADQLALCSWCYGSVELFSNINKATACIAVSYLDRFMSTNSPIVARCTPVSTTVPTGRSGMHRHSSQMSCRGQGQFRLCCWYYLSGFVAERWDQFMWDRDSTSIGVETQ